MLQINETKSIRLDISGWGSYSPVNYARNWNLIKRTNGTWTTQNPSKKRRLFSFVFRGTNDHLISARWLDLVMVNKKRRTWQIVDFAIPTDHSVKLKESEKIGKCLDLDGELKKKNNWKWDHDTNCNRCARYSHQRISIWIGGLWNLRTRGDYPNYSSLEIGQNTEKSPRDLRSFTVNVTPPKKQHLLTLVWKNSPISKKKW